MKKAENNISKMETPQNYEAPALECVEVKVEKGFGTSDPITPAESPIAPESPPSSGPWK